MSHIFLPAYGSASFRDPVATTAALPLTDPANSVRLVTADKFLYEFDGAVWTKISPPVGSTYYRDPVATFAALPGTDPAYTVRLVQADGVLYYYNGVTWLPTDPDADTYLASVATFAALPGTDPAYTVRLVQGEGVLYYYTGSAWQKIISTGSLSTGTQAANTTTGVGLTGVFGNVTSVSLTVGTWIIQGVAGFNENGAVLTTSLEAGISASSSGAGISEFDTIVMPFTTSGADAVLATPLVQVTLGSTTTYYLNTRFNYTSGTPKHRGRIQARLIGLT